MNLVNNVRTIPTWMKAATIAVFVALVGTAAALPQYAAEFKQSCRLCHHNPAGGGMRTLYGAQFFSYMDLPVKNVTDLSELDQVRPDINRNFQIGFDLRTMAFADNRRPKQNTFFTMQTDLYVALMPSDRTLAYVELPQTGQGERFLLYQGLMREGAVKVGRFIPNYGWRFANHKTFTREKLGFGPTSLEPVAPDNGLEIGYYPMDWEASVALTNGTQGLLDADVGKAATLRGMRRFTASGVNLSAGGSFRYSPLGLNGPVTRLVGVFGGANWQAYTYLAEVDLISKAATGLVASHLLAWKVMRGWTVTAAGDFYDPDLDQRTGIERRVRLSSEIHWTGYLELVPAWEWHVTESPSGTQKFATLEAQLHFWF